MTEEGGQVVTEAEVKDAVVVEEVRGQTTRRVTKSASLTMGSTLAMDVPMNSTTIENVVMNITAAIALRGLVSRKTTRPITALTMMGRVQMELLVELKPP